MADAVTVNPIMFCDELRFWMIGIQKEIQAMLRRMTVLFLTMVLLIAALPAAGAEVYVTSVKMSLGAMALLDGGEGRQLSAAVLPENASNPRIYWMSSNESVATVDDSGFVTPHGKGTTVITAQTSNMELDTCTVTVTDNPVTGIAISRTELTIEDRTAYVLESQVSPLTAENLDVTWSSSDKSVAVVNQNGKVFAKSPGECWISATANGGVDIVARCRLTVEASGRPMKYIAITFDDGPCDNTLDILDILEEYDVHATFFCLGKLVASHPDYVRKAYARGHEIANHSYNHETLTKLDPDEAKKEMTDTDEAIKAAIGVEAAVYRAPGGSINEKTATYIGKPFIDWTVDTNDWKYRDPEHVWTFIARNSGNYDIVLMHDIRPTTMEAMKKAIPWLLENGFTLVTVSELLDLVGGVDETMIYAP